MHRTRFLTDRDHIRQCSLRGNNSFEMFKTFTANLRIKLCVQRAYSIRSAIVQRLPRHSSRIVDIWGLSRHVVEFIFRVMPYAGHECCTIVLRFQQEHIMRYSDKTTNTHDQRAKLPRVVANERRLYKISGEYVGMSYDGGATGRG